MFTLPDNFFYLLFFGFYILGHLVDPDEVPGIAHFCEHMLFLGTEKVKLKNLIILIIF